MRWRLPMSAVPAPVRISVEGKNRRASGDGRNKCQHLGRFRHQGAGPEMTARDADEGSIAVVEKCQLQPPAFTDFAMWTGRRWRSQRFCDFRFGFTAGV